MEATIVSEDSVEVLGQRGAFVRVCVLEKKGFVTRELGVIVFGDLVTFRTDGGGEKRLAVRRCEISLFHAAKVEPIADTPAELVPLAQRGTGGEICVSIRAFRSGERVRLVGERPERIEELA